MTPSILGIAARRARQRRLGVAARRAALTLAELVAVAAIMAILLGIAAPRYQSFLKTQRLRNAAGRVAMDFRIAQAEAIKSQRYVTVQFNVSRSAYQTVYPSTETAVPGTRVVRLGTDDTYRTTMASADFSGEAETVFDRFGLPLASGSVVLGISDLRVTVAVDAASGKITISELTRDAVLAFAVDPINNPPTFGSPVFKPPTVN